MFYLPLVQYPQRMSVFKWRRRSIYILQSIFGTIIASSWLKTSYIRNSGSRDGATWRLPAVLNKYLLFDLLFASSWLKTNYIRKSGSWDSATWRFSEVFKQYLLIDLFIAASWQRTSWCRWTDRCFAVWPTWRPSPSMATRSGQSSTMWCKQKSSLIFLVTVWWPQSWATKPPSASAFRHPASQSGTGTLISVPDWFDAGQSGISAFRKLYESGKGYTLHVQTAGGGNGYTTLHAHTRLQLVLSLIYDVEK